MEEKKQTENSIYQNSQKYIEFAIRDADILWKKILKEVKNNPDIKNWDDNKKIEFFYKENKEFYNEFPIVCRYMITMGQYSNKAFRKYLVLKALDAKNLPAPENREKDFMEDKWVKREADYITLLWKSYMKGKKDEKQAKMIWEHAYASLKKEFTDFRDMYKQTELKLNAEMKINKKELIKEVLGRIVTPEKQEHPIDMTPEHGVIPPKNKELDLDKKRQLRDILLMKLIEQYKSKVIEEIKNTIKKYDP